MPNDVVIRAEGLGKKYVIGHQAERERYVAMRDVIARGAKDVARRTADMFRGRAVVSGDTTEEFWALKDVNFDVHRGDVIGVIGRNGAGKSTLLKILSRITEPTEGRVTIKGRVASLLEVGTGFHPELTGRENIYLNGAILGMSQREIARKFDEIVAFSEIERFLDTPVKRYSSGMYVRLAFAVAAHLEPEILIVDEVLAVGDAEFQKKCLGKMGAVAEQGRTVIVVSHNLSLTRALCSKAVLLKGGAIAKSGQVGEVISHYVDEPHESKVLTSNRLDMSAFVELVKMPPATGVVVTFDVTLKGPLSEPRIGIGLNDSQGVRIATLFSETYRRLPAVAANERTRLRLRTEPVRFMPGTLSIKVALAEAGHDIETHEDVLRVVIPEYAAFSSPAFGQPSGLIFIQPSLELHEGVRKISA
ncbi:MAG: ABC transporter ATP-binding protein [Hyphomicrobium sp.]